MSYRINREIKTPKIRLVGEHAQGGNEIISTEEALKRAEELELDLVEISPQADPPVCKILDYNKFLYEEKKKQKRMKQNAAKVEVKEIRISTNIDQHDFDFKLKHARKFLEEGNKVKVVLMFKGRTIHFVERGEELLAKFALSLEDVANPESTPKMENKIMTIVLAPIKKKK